MPPLNSRVVRRLLRAVALSPIALLPLSPVSASAVAPVGWPEAEPVSAMEFLLVLLVLPMALFLVITVLASVPKMVRGERYTPGLAWRNENEWFGGPKDGLAATDRTDPKAISADADRGGASARW